MADSSMRFIKAKNATSILKITRVEKYDRIADIEGKNAIYIYISSNYYNYEQIKEYLTQNDISEIEMYFCLAVAPDSYEAGEKTTLVDSFSGYTKELDINYDTETKSYCVILQKETDASLLARENRAQGLEAQEALIELLEGGI